MTKLQNITVLYFGSFNPFHIGHAAIAKFVAALPWVEELCFVLSPKNPIKESNTLQDAHERWEDLQRVVRKLNQECQSVDGKCQSVENKEVSGLNPAGDTQYSVESTQNTEQQSAHITSSGTAPATKFTASDIEFHLEPPLYTYNTLQRLSNDFPDKNFALLIGGDNIQILHKWYRGVEIMEQYPIMVYPREGVDTKKLCEETGAIFIDAPQVNVSSTQIRTMQEAGEDTSALRY